MLGQQHDKDRVLRLVLRVQLSVTATIILACTGDNRLVAPDLPYHGVRIRHRSGQGGAGDGWAMLGQLHLLRNQPLPHRRVALQKQYGHCHGRRCCVMPCNRIQIHLSHKQEQFFLQGRLIVCLPAMSKLTRLSTNCSSERLLPSSSLAVTRSYSKPSRSSPEWGMMGSKQCQWTIIL